MVENFILVESLEVEDVVWLELELELELCLGAEE